jgi:AcrR family transcriptional regulator
MSNPRAYNSPIRQKNADETRDRIASAARKLMIDLGFDGTTIEAIAHEAGISAQTVYAVFGSKRGIVAHLMQRARFGNAYAAQVSKVMQAPDPIERLRFVAGVARRIFESGKSELDVLRGAGAVSPELAMIGRKGEDMRYELQAPNAEFLLKSKALRAGVTQTMARDVIWMFTSPDIFRMLVVDRGWSADRYETWVGEMMARALLEKYEPKKPSKRTKPAKKSRSRK